MELEHICIFVWLIVLTFIPVSIFVMQRTLMPLLRLRARLYAKRKGINLNKMRPEIHVHRKEAK